MKAHKLNKGDKIAIVSLSKGLLGMPFIKHELDLGIKRLKELGLEPVFMPNSLKDMDYLLEHPEARAEDLKEAFRDESIKGIIAAIGGDDTYKTFEYLMEDEEFKELVQKNPKLFTGYSDTTNNHLMLNKLGLSTFYGPCFLVDLAELDTNMLPYTKEYFMKYFRNEPFQIKSSDTWYMERENFSPSAVGTPRKLKIETHGFETLNGKGKIRGRLYGGCLESIYEAYAGVSKEVYEKYQILPIEDEWKEKILFLETSDEKITPEQLEKCLNELKSHNIFNLVRGVIVGKPMDETYYEEYKEIYKKVFSDMKTPVLYNVNFGHAFPRCIIPYDAIASIDYDSKNIFIEEKIFND